MRLRLDGKDYKAVFEAGKSAKGRFVAVWKSTGKGKSPQVGVIASKKGFHLAVERNRAKRLMREAFRQLVREGVVEAGTSWILVARGGMKDKKCADVVWDLRRVVKKCANF